VRGFLGTPVDGSVVSWGYRGAICEYPDTGIEGYDAGAGVDYSFNGNDGLHLTFADEKGFDLIVLRGGAKTRLYENNTELVEPRGRKSLHEFEGSGTTQVVRFPVALPLKRRASSMSTMALSPMWDFIGYTGREMKECPTMDVPYLITGAASGAGFAICSRKHPPGPSGTLSR